jgi:sulfur carrier protein
MTMNTQSAAAANQTLVHLSVNGEDRSVGARTLADLIAELGYGDAKVATALNGEFVPERSRGSHSLSDGDKVEIVAPRQGG